MAWIDAYIESSLAMGYDVRMKNGQYEGVYCALGKSLVENNNQQYTM